MPSLLSLFDYSGAWALPFAHNGWSVTQWDIKLSEFMDIMVFDSVETCFDIFDESFDGILAAPPCTDFTVSGAQYWPIKDEDGRTHKSLEYVNQVLRLVDLYRPTDPDYEGNFFWAMENPVGRMAKLAGLKDAYYFNPCDFAGYLNPGKRIIERLDEIRQKGGIGVTAEETDFVVHWNAYNKKTGLWGEFNRAGMIKKPLEPVKCAPQGTFTQRYGGKSAKTKEARSNTPMGFAWAFYEANKDYNCCLYDQDGDGYGFGSGGGGGYDDDDDE